MNIIKYLFWFAIFFILHYIEGFPSIAGFSVAQLWKLPLIVYLLLNAIQSRSNTFRFEKYGYYYSSFPFLSLDILQTPLNVLLFSIKQLPVILFFRFWQRLKKETLVKVLIILSQFICLASFLTLTNIVQPVKRYLSAESFIEGQSYYSSVFGSPHAASSYFCVASLVLIYFLINRHFVSTINKIYNIILLCVGVYSLFLSYTRTGWIMFIISLLFIVNFKKINLKKKFCFFFILIIGGIGIVSLYNNNDAFRLRISGGGQYKGESSSLIDTEGSGRTDFWKNGIELWADSDLYCFLLGSGTRAVVDNNKVKTGMSVGSHSLFVDALAKYGLVTFVLLILFFYYQYRFIIGIGRGSPYQSLCKSLLIGSILFAFFQGEIYFDYAVIYSIALVLMYKTNYNLNENIIYRTM